MNFKTVRNTVIGGSILVGGMMGAGEVLAQEECPAYPPSPCNTTPETTTTVETTIPQDTTTVPDELIPETGNNRVDTTLYIAAVTLAAGAAISVASRRRAT